MIVRMHDASEVIALVGANKHPLYPDTHVFLWDVRRRLRKEIICEASVLSIGLRLNRYHIYF